MFYVIYSFLCHHLGHSCLLLVKFIGLLYQARRINKVLFILIVITLGARLFSFYNLLSYQLIITIIT